MGGKASPGEKFHVHTSQALSRSLHSRPSQNATFLYDGDGKRVKSIINSAIITYFVGAHYEGSGSTVTKYYYAGAQRIAMRTNGTLNYLLGDHLGSTSLTADAAGNKVSEVRYKPWGEVRYAWGNLPTKYQYTGQFSYEAEFGLYFYNARWYDSYLNHFTQPDSIVPDPYNSQDWDRYSYVRNNPLRYTDPSGHFCYDADKNKFTDGDCFDEMQQELLDQFIEQLESGDYTDVELMENLIEKALELNSDPVIALRAASEIVREDTPDDFEWSFTRSKFYYADHTKSSFDDSGFGDLMDTQNPNQIGHTIGIAYIAAYEERRGRGGLAGVLVWGNELGNQSAKQKNVDRALGYIATDLGKALIANESEAVSNAVSQIEAYDYAEEHPVRNWWDSIQWPWEK